MKQMESLIARFFWGSTNDSKRTHWISWEQICHPIEEGGLGVRRFKEMVAAFGMKLWWRFRAQDSLWAQFMLRKYCHHTAPSKIHSSKHHSPTWRRMVRASSMVHSQVKWSIGDGAMEFWDDIWLKNHTIRHYCHPDAIINRKQVKEFWSNNRWDEHLLRSTLIPLGVPSGIIEDILTVPVGSEGRDVMRWGLTTHGNFTTSSAWNLIRYQQPRTASFGFIWNPALSPSISIFVWRLLANRVPVDAKLQWRNIHLASKCRCCKSPKTETREHLFIQGKAAAKIWRYYANWFPDDPLISETATDLDYRISFWHQRMAHPKKGHIRIVLPCLVLWHIWTERNNVIHRGAVFNANLVIDRINQYLQWTISAKQLGKQMWTECTPQIHFNFPVEGRRDPIGSRTIKWISPQPNWIKLNTDGAFKTTLESSGGGGIIRDEKGTILGGFAESFYACSGLEAELKAINKGLVMANQWGNNIWVETDAREVVNILANGNQGAADIRHIVASIRIKLKDLNVRISHIHREGNKIADYLAKQGSMQESHQFLDHFSAPPLVKALAHMDRLGLPNFRNNQEGGDI